MSFQELIYYQDGDITITNTRAILGPKTYTMANITSVSTEVIPPNRTLGVIIAIIGGLIALGAGIISIIGFIQITDPEDIPILLAFNCMTLVGLVVMVFGIVLARRQKTKYAVRIGSASGEANALISRDQNYIEKIVMAMNEAIVNRG